jgi:leucyl-tRNA---protein transferase
MRLQQHDKSILENLELYPSPEHACSYLPGRRARTIFGDPAIRLNSRVYSVLIDCGFRRSGSYVYRPACPGCNACVPVRIPVAEFAPRRIDRRIRRLNANLTVEAATACFRDEDFRLYERYLHARHAGGGMDGSDPGQYLGFLTCNWMETAFYRFFAADRLVAVAVTDRLLQGLSAVYTFFDPALEARSLGSYAILWQIEEARRLELPYVYLGYWIEECPKMRYKAQYRPLEALRHGTWARL